MSAHIATDDLADAAAGLLDEGRTAEIDAHVASCATCADVRLALDEVSSALAAEPTPTMPDDVFARLRAVVVDEQERRDCGEAEAEAARRIEALHRQRPSLGSFGAELPRSPRTRFLFRALVACALAAVVGFGGYVVSAASGLNEPGSSPAFVSSSALGSEADALKSARDLSAHRFSQAWNCARGVTDGRITAISNAVVDGVPALLVYTSRDGEKWVTVVSGCDTERPQAGPSAVLDR